MGGVRGESGMKSEAAIRKALRDRRTSQKRGRRSEHTLAALAVFTIPPPWLWSTRIVCGKCSPSYVNVSCVFTLDRA